MAINLSKNRPNQTVILNNGKDFHYNVWVTKVKDTPLGATAVFTIGKINYPVALQDWDAKTWKQI